ncbi:MAG: sensor histidine kinase N-terminal domain-containing protein [Paludibacterium sp.]|uniref:ATP-binding protein n=1 Tax=Paludibacterium sp. TaxID=1917523 RepID=UPI0025D36114|nr:ATP-binding protein [Paludibacterium sp.]MBV8046078.1 sensor histidine kinase N-terminal domain-containing protein [Paludibacterium sp.]MBV8646167.1 sensor histidine kinase N-terminal domain-containing protein [Paludibacterium sp.]
MSRVSLQRRIVVALLLIAPMMWLLSTVVALYQTREEINELYDAQLQMLAHQLMTSVRAEANARPPMRGYVDVDGDEDGDALAQAVWRRDGQLIWADGIDADWQPPPGEGGFVLRRTHHGEWRVYVLRATDGERVVAVGQRVKARNRATLKVVISQLWAWLLPLPLLLLALVLAVRRGLAPLSRLAGELARRRSDDLSPVDHPVPAEAQPLIAALNQLFSRVEQNLEHERRFTADAAHELRSPLAALRVQAEVAQLAREPEVMTHALDNLTVGIERATRLVDQLLALSRLDPLQGLANAQPIDWAALVDGVRREVAPLAARRGCSLQVVWHDPANQVLPLSGDATLLSLMLRNLLENALRYSPPGAAVQLICDRGGLAVEDNGPGIDAAWLEKVRQRFVREPGQREPGSGLGLSIVERIAELHGLHLTLSNRSPNGLRAALTPQDAA